MKEYEKSSALEAAVKTKENHFRTWISGKAILLLLFQISSVALADFPDTYSINLMWINRTLNETAKYISSANSKEELVETLLMPAVKWAIANPTAEVSLWYDRVHVSSKAIENTNQILNELLVDKKIKNVEIRNIREIPIVKANPDAFSSMTPDYFRVDLLKPIIVLHSVENEHKEAAIFSDLQVGDQRYKKDRMKKGDLFHPIFMSSLNEYGLLLNRHLNDVVENQFLQLVNNPRMISTIKHAIINANLIRAETALNSTETQRREWIPNLGSVVYFSTTRDVYHYYNLTAPGKSIQVRPDIIGLGTHSDPMVDFDPKVHGYLPLGNVLLKNTDKEPVVYRKEGISQRRDVLSFENSQYPGPSRNAQVRPGNNHYSEWSDLTYQSPADGGNIYRIELCQ